MQSKEVALAILLVISSVTAVSYYWSTDNNSNDEINLNNMFDPLLQDEGHNHRNASEHEFWTDNIEFVSYNELTKPGNAEIQVAASPDGNTYAYQAGWKGFHIIDVTDPSNTTVTAWYNDPYTQVLDIKYLQYNGREYIICQNQIVDSGQSDPNVGDWDDPAQVSVNLVDVTDKSDPQWIDSWYDTDHPSGPHNLYTYMIKNEWYIFVANPDYEDCDIGTGDACGGITIAHLNFDANSDLPRIFKVGEAEVSWETTRGGWIYIHDMTVQKWPGIDTNDPRFGRTFIYGAYWEAGLRIFDVSDVPHPDDPDYIAYATACYTHTVVICNWRAPEVGYWMDFADLNGDDEPDSSTASNSSSVNGGRASYIHYAEPYPVMVDASHLGMGDDPVHLTFIATEVLETTNGTGLSYLLDTTDYSINGNSFTFQPKLLSAWENPFGADHHIPGGEEWLLFSPHNADTVWFDTSGGGDTSHGGTWDGRIYMGNYHSGLWVLDVETLMVGNGYLDNTYREATVGYYLPHGADGVPLDSQFYDFGWVPFLWTAEYHNGYVYLSCITSGLYIVQLDLDVPYVGTNLAVSED
jgi:hypothetical protein